MSESELSEDERESSTGDSPRKPRDSECVSFLSIRAILQALGAVWRVLTRVYFEKFWCSESFLGCWPHDLDAKNVNYN